LQNGLLVADAICLLVIFLMIGFGTGITECPEHHTLYSVARICLICVAEHVLAHRGGFAGIC